MANRKSGAERYNDRMAKLHEDCRQLERERLKRGEMPNPSLTSPEEARKYGWEIKGREVKKLQVKVTDEMVRLLKAAVQSLEDSWDAQRDLELEIGRDFDSLGEWVADLAVCGADGVDEGSVRDLLLSEED